MCLIILFNLTIYFSRKYKEYFVNTTKTFWVLKVKETRQQQNILSPKLKQKPKPESKCYAKTEQFFYYLVYIKSEVFSKQNLKPKYWKFLGVVYHSCTM